MTDRRTDISNYRVASLLKKTFGCKIHLRQSTKVWAEAQGRGVVDMGGVGRIGCSVDSETACGLVL